MHAVLFWLASVLATGAPPPVPVPGLCTEAATAHVGEPGCYLSAEIDLAGAGATLHWHLHEFADLASAKVAAARLPHALVVQAHGRVWLHALGPANLRIEGGTPRADVGPLDVPPHGKARLLESWFPPGMKTRAHAHPGPEVFYVVDGEQCVETPEGRRLIQAGEHFTVSAGAHLQAAPRGRRSIVLLLVPADAAWMQLTPDWQPQGLCDG